MGVPGHDPESPHICADSREVMPDVRAVHTDGGACKTPHQCGPLREVLSGIPMVHTYQRGGRILREAGPAIPVQGERDDPDSDTRLDAEGQSHATGGGMCKRRRDKTSSREQERLRTWLRLLHLSRPIPRRSRFAPRRSPPRQSGLRLLDRNRPLTQSVRCLRPVWGDFTLFQLGNDLPRAAPPNSISCTPPRQQGRGRTPVDP